MQGLVSVSVCCPSGSVVSFDIDTHDSVIDIKQVLQDTVDGCQYTNFHLELEASESEVIDPVLSDYLEVSQVMGQLHPNLSGKDEKQEPVVDVPADSLRLRLIPDSYDERSAREHLRRFRHILQFPPAPIDPEAWIMQLKKNTDINAAKEAKTANNIDADFARPIKSLSLKHVMDEEESSTSLEVKQDNNSSKKKNKKEAASSSALPVCLRKIVLSSWNPVPGNRKLQGDLFYLEVQTLEGHTVYVTAAVGGFFVNQCSTNVFNPAPAASPCHSSTLVELMKKISLGFCDKFEQLLHRKVAEHPFAAIPSQFPVNDWCVSAPKHTVDHNRAEDSALYLYGLEDYGMLRSWNDEYQACLEMPKDTPHDRVIRARVLARIHSEFASASVKGAQAVVDGNIPPINPMEPERAHVWVFNNIFFSQANDGRDVYKEFGGADVNYKIAGLDLRGVAAFQEVEVDGVCALLTCLVNYRGRRVVCQGVIPGILHGDQLSSLIYGYMDDGVSVSPNEKFVQLLEEGAKRLNIAARAAVDPSGQQVCVPSAVEVKGITGSDRRMYVLDLVRTTPRDANYSDPKKHIAHVLRHELVRYFVYIHAQEMERNAAEQQTIEGQSAQHVDEKAEPLFDESKLMFNLNAFTVYENPQDELLSADKELVVKASKFLVDNVIPGFVQELVSGSSSPIDSASLTAMMHKRGINMRYLGMIVSELEKVEEGSKFLEQVKTLILREIVIRSAKHYFNHILQLPLNYLGECSLADVLAKLLNSLVGQSAFGHGVLEDKFVLASEVLKQHREMHFSAQAAVASSSGSSLLNSSNLKKAGSLRKKQVKKPVMSTKAIDVRSVDGKRVPSSLLAAVNLWRGLTLHALEHFGYGFSVDMSAQFGEHDRLCVVREVCKKVGIQVECRDYSFSNSDAPFSTADINSLVPVLKVAVPAERDVQELIYLGRMNLADGNLQASFEIFMDALHMLHQVVGPMHSDSALCYSSLAFTCYNAGDFLQALEHQHRALVISKTVHGKDHYETAQNYGAFALFLHTNGYSESALHEARRNYELLELLCGPEHFETAASLFNTAIILHDIGRHHLAVENLLEALKRFEMSVGEDHPQVAACHHALAIAYCLIASFRQAIDHEKRANRILVKLFGAQHARVQESNAWAAHFTSCAVKFEKGLLEQIVQPETVQLGSWIFTGSHMRIQRQRVYLNDILRYMNAQGNQEGVAKVQQALEKILSKQEISQPLSVDSQDQPESVVDSPAAPAVKSSKKKRSNRRKASRKSVGDVGSEPAMDRVEA
eukprot:TRINITY_DN893_c0_g1_i1.p1 TRINITY_DN893_c0_g1~~TRINITY_DN893_c0_g1_i1.p1  ORF type:complete len:1282 (-),score=316.74 TRINITY_DN893_c0_g1_i1:63-3908(-)